MDKLDELKKIPHITHIFKTPRAGETVDNGCGLEFELDEFAVFFSCNDNYRNDIMQILFDVCYKYWENHHEMLDVMTFYNVKNTEELSNKLKARDGYELVWSSDINKEL